MGKSKKEKTDNNPEAGDRLKTTLDSSPKVAVPKDTESPKRPQAEVVIQKITQEPKILAETPASEAPAIEAPAALAQPVRQDNHDRDRRNNPDGRRGRSAEKAPAGTRTKMLKIIYERKAEIQEKRRFYLIVKTIFAVVALASLFFAARATFNSAASTTSGLVQSLDISTWYERFSTPVKLPTKVVAPAIPKPAARVTNTKPSMPANGKKMISSKAKLAKPKQPTGQAPAITKLKKVNKQK